MEAGWASSRDLGRRRCRRGSWPVSYSGAAHLWVRAAGCAGDQEK